MAAQTGSTGGGSLTVTASTQALVAGPFVHDGSSFRRCSARILAKGAGTLSIAVKIGGQYYDLILQATAAITQSQAGVGAGLADNAAKIEDFIPPSGTEWAVYFLDTSTADNPVIVDVSQISM